MALDAIALLVALFFVGCCLLLHVVRGRGSRRGPAITAAHDEDEEADEDENEREKARGGGRGARARPQRAGTRPQPPLSRLERMKREKERKRAERREAHEAAHEARREEREGEGGGGATTDAADEEAWAAREQAALEELREAKRRQDDAEYAKWIGHIAVDERGELTQESHQRREAVISFLMRHVHEVNTWVSARESREDADNQVSNILVLQDTARSLQVSVEELVAVIEELIREEKLFGVFDDRGKFVVMSEQHLPMIAKFITQRGRVSVTELARECNRIILQRGLK